MHAVRLPRNSEGSAEKSGGENKERRRDKYVCPETHEIRRGRRSQRHDPHLHQPIKGGPCRLEKNKAEHPKTGRREESIFEKRYHEIIEKIKEKAEAAGRFKRTHGHVLNLHTRERVERVIANSAYPKWPTWSYHVPQRFTESNTWIFPIFKYENRCYPCLSLSLCREQHVPHSSNLSFYLMKLLSSSYPEGNVGGNQL